MKRIFISHENIKADLLSITGDDFHHIKNVLRKKVGDLIELSDFGWKYKAEIISINDNSIKLKVLEKNIIEPSKVKIRLFQALPKKKLEDIISKITELGVWEFYPTITQRTIVHIEKKDEWKKLEKWQKIVLENAKKIGIPKPMKICNILKLSEVNQVVLPDETKIVFWECEEDRKLKDLQILSNETKPINVLVGPEGGFAIKEIEFLRKSGWETVSLGNRIYTVETATLVSIANILYELESRN